MALTDSQAAFKSLYLTYFQRLIRFTRLYVSSTVEADQLNNAIEALPAKCKTAFKLVREDKLKYKEVAAILEISVKTLEAHLATAIKKLREFLRKEE